MSSVVKNTNSITKTSFIGILITIIISFLLHGFITVTIETYLTADDTLSYAIPIAVGLACILFSVYNTRSDVLNSGLLFGSVILICQTLSDNWHRIPNNHKVIALGSTLSISAAIAYNKMLTL